MSQGCALLILTSKRQRSRSWGIVNCKWFPDHNWLCNPPMIMKLHTHAPHESRMCPIDFRVKGQGHGALMIENSFWTITNPVIHLWSWNFMHLLPWVKDVPYWFRGQKVKGQGHMAVMIENGFRTITDPVIHLGSWNFMHLLLMSQGSALLISGSKGQRSRSWGIDDWKRFPDHNWPCNPPMIMKLHALAPHESRMHAFDFGVKRSKVKVMGHWWLKMVSGP